MFRSRRSQDEDRQPWYDLGNAYEREFCTRKAYEIGVEATVNPKKTCDPTVPDLLVNGILSDLKVRTRPFFMAQSKYGIDPQYCVMFNRKDYDHYRRKYPDLLLYWWVWWEQTDAYIGGNHYAVRPMVGVWRCSFAEVMNVASKGIFGQVKWGNGCDSFALDLRSFFCIQLNLS